MRLSIFHAYWLFGFHFKRRGCSCLLPIFPLRFNFSVTLIDLCDFIKISLPCHAYCSLLTLLSILFLIYDIQVKKKLHQGCSFFLSLFFAHCFFLLPSIADVKEYIILFTIFSNTLLYYLLNSLLTTFGI